MFRGGGDARHRIVGFGLWKREGKQQTCVAIFSVFWKTIEGGVVEEKEE